MSTKEIPSFPKIFALGAKYVDLIFDSEVEITEKIDGSQFGFAKINNELHMRSKGATLYEQNPEKMFSKAITYIASIKDLLPENVIFHGEYLRSPKHNTLEYKKTPLNHIALFSASNSAQKFFNHQELTVFARQINVDVVPLLFKGKVDSEAWLKELIQSESVLGNCEMEGIVAKNYKQELFIGGQVLPITCAKYVSEKFKEVHQTKWKTEKTNSGKWQTFSSQYCNEQRWEKSVQHLKESGQLDGSPKDIGSLIKSVQVDISEECKPEITDFLWRQFGKELLRGSVKGLPEWYKQKLMSGMFQ